MAMEMSRQLPPLPGMPVVKRRDRHPDWDEFYKNGMPKEIIVIDDDSPPPPTKKTRTGYDSYSAYTSGDSASTDRTTSLQTAPTSLSSGSLPEETVGQKRKRVTRQQLADEKKRKDVDILGDPHSIYVPPPKPPIKAKDVHVPQIKDVCS